MQDLGIGRIEYEGLYEKQQKYKGINNADISGFRRFAAIGGFFDPYFSILYVLIFLIVSKIGVDTDCLIYEKD